MKSLKNNTGSDIIVRGQTIAAGQYYLLSQFEENAWRDDSDIEALIDSGSVIYNDGVDVTNTSKAKELLNAADATQIRNIIVETNAPGNGEALLYNSTTDEIEWGNSLSGIGTVLPYPFIANGNTANRWMGTYESSHFSDQSPLVLPQESELKGMTFMNMDNNVDIDVEVYRNGILAKVFEVRNKRFAYVVGITPSVTMAQGDRVSVYLKKHTGGSGDNTAQDPNVTLLMKIVGETGADNGQQNGVT
jgi:hypothetical protein